MYLLTIFKPKQEAVLKLVTESEGTVLDVKCAQMLNNVYSDVFSTLYRRFFSRSRFQTFQLTVSFFHFSSVGNSII